MKKYKPEWLNRYLVISVLVHLLILLLISNLSKVQPVKETPLTFEIVNPVMPKPKAPPKPKTLAKSEPILKPKPMPKPKPQPIRHYRDEKPIDLKAKLSINKDGKLKRKTTSARKQASLKLDKQELLNKMISSPPPAVAEKTEVAKPMPSEAVAKKQPHKFLVEAVDVFIKQQPEKKDNQLDEAEKPSLEEVLANLEKYIDFDKYSEKAYYFGDNNLSFEDQDFHYMWYGRIIKRRVSDGWYPPYVARMGLTGRTVITFRIKHDGQLTEITLRESSGNRSLDQAALNAIKSVGSLPALPEDYPRPSLGVTFSFWYNLHVPRQRGAG